MKIDKASRRDKKRRKRSSGMVVTGKSLFLIQEIKIKRAEKIKSKLVSDAKDFPVGWTETDK